MNEKLEECIDELKGSLRRAEHSNYVSLKYTRTVDVIRNLLDRYIQTIREAMTCLLLKLEEEKKVYEVPDTLIEKVNLLKENVEDEEVQEMLDFLLYLRKCKRSDYESVEEYRRHVACIVKVEGEELYINIDLLDEWFQNLKAQVEHVIGMVEDEE